MKAILESKEHFKSTFIGQNHRTNCKMEILIDQNTSLKSLFVMLMSFVTSFAGKFSQCGPFPLGCCNLTILNHFSALQLPPEAWLRLCTFNCSLTYLTIRPTGTVSARMLGDVGHIPYGLTTFSMHRGFNW